MIKLFVVRLVKKYGLKVLLLKIGDMAVKVTKSKKDDELWKKVKKLLASL
jgi:hypothetical protein